MKLHNVKKQQINKVLFDQGICFFTLILLGLFEGGDLVIARPVVFYSLRLFFSSVLFLSFKFLLLSCFF